MIQALDWPPRAADYARVSRLSGRDDGRGDRPRQASPSGSELVGLGVAIALAVLVPLVAGLLIDKAVSSSPLGLFVGLAIGIVAAIVLLTSRLRRYL